MKSSGRDGVAVLACCWPSWLSGRPANDVQIPPETGTEFSIVDLIGSGPAGGVRTEVAVQLADRHGLRFVHAPLRVTGRGTPPR